MTLKQPLISAFLAIGMLSVGCARMPASVPSNTSSQAAPTAAPLADVFPVPVVELEGTPTGIGAEHARRLGAPIKLLHDQYLMKFLGSTAKRFIALAAAKAFEGQLLPEHRDEVEAMSTQLDMDPRETMLGQCFLDLTPMTACSTVTLSADAAPDHVARFGRNLDFPSLNVADKYTTVFIYHPRGRYAFASIGWPGLVGVLSGMNEHGLALANMEVTRGARLPSAMPYSLLYRTVLERCSTVDEAVAMLRETPRQTANNLMLMDATGARAVAEITPQAVNVRCGQEGAGLISTNHTRGHGADAPGACWRYDALHRSCAAEFGHIDRPILESMLGEVEQGRDTLQSMIFEPAGRVIYLSAGTRAAEGDFHRLDLKPYFKK